MEEKDNLIWNNEVMSFVNDQFGEIRTIVKDNNIWFAAVDICNILGIKNPTDAVKKQLLDSERARFNLGRQGDGNFVSESGFYTLVLRSRKPIATPFRLWITSEVIPQIRLTGGYIPVSKEDDEKVILAKAMKIMQRTIEEKDTIIESQNKIIENMEDDVEAYHDLTKAEGCLKLIDVAAVIETGRSTLTSFLRNCNVITKQSGFNTPYRRFIKNGMFKVRTTSVNGHVTTTPMVTAKGLNYMYKLMKKKDALKDFNADALLQTIEELEVANA